MLRFQRSGNQIGFDRLPYRAKPLFDWRAAQWTTQASITPPRAGFVDAERGMVALAGDRCLLVGILGSVAADDADAAKVPAISPFGLGVLVGGSQVRAMLPEGVLFLAGERAGVPVAPPSDCPANQPQF